MLTGCEGLEGGVCVRAGCGWTGVWMLDLKRIMVWENGLVLDGDVAKVGMENCIC